MVAISWRIVSTAFFIRSSASLTCFGSILDLHGHPGADGLAPEGAGQVPGHGHVEHDDREPVLHPHRERGLVHDAEPPVDRLAIAENLETGGRGISPRILGEDPVHL